MNKQLLRRAIFAVVGTTFAISAIVYPVLGGGLQRTASSTAIAEASAPANTDDKANEIVAALEQAISNEDSGKVVMFSGDAATVTKAELEAIVGEKEAKKAVSASDISKSVSPATVAKAKAPALGLNSQTDTFVHIGDKDGKSEILVSHGEQKYILTLAFIPGKGWVLVSSREVVDTVKPSNKIITGTVKLDTQKLSDLQKLVDYGYQTWRLNPLQVAKIQGQAFGFSRYDDSFELMPSILIYRERGEANVLVKHGKKYYQIHLVQPFGNTKDKIWTIASVKETNADGSTIPEPNPVYGTIYTNSLLDNWTWSKGRLPRDMAFTAVIDLDYQRKKDTRFRSDIWDIVSSYDHKNNVLLLAYLGAMPTGGYDIGVKKVSVNGQEVTIQVALKSPAHNTSVTTATTYPFDVVPIPKNKLPLHKEVTFKFVDTKGNLLTTVKASIR